MSVKVRTISRSSFDLSPTLPGITFELTERCNNNCIHCCINQPEGDISIINQECSTHEVKDYLQQAADLGCLHVTFTGGEPLLRIDFIDLYLFTRQLGMSVSLYTNARLITKELAELFHKIPPMENIEITVYGMHEDSYDAVSRSPGSFLQFWHGVQLLQEYSVPFIVKSAYVPQNMHEKNEFENWASTIPWMKSKPIYAAFFELRQRNDNPVKNRQIGRLRESNFQINPNIENPNEAERLQIDQFSANYLGPSGDHLFLCSVGKSITIDAYGRIQPCLGIRSPQLTLPKGTSLVNALSSFQKLKELKATNADYISRCAKCFLKSFCNQCPARSWSENSTLDTPVEYICKVTHQRARNLGLLNDNEKAWEVTDWQQRRILSNL
jgi:radical SAM protein with 4Fe4S-binding SPASM domain